MKKFLLTVFFSFLTMAAFAQTGSLVREDRIWNYRWVYDADRIVREEGDAGYHFKGTEEREGEEYCVLYNGADEKVALMRQEGGKVWRYFDDMDNPENYPSRKLLLYNLDLTVGEEDTWYGLATNEGWVGYGDDGYCEFWSNTVTLKEISHFSNNADEWSVYTYRWLSDYIQRAVVDGVGMDDSLIHVPTVADHALSFPATGIELVSMTDLEGNVLFEEEDFERILTSVRGVEIEEPNSPARFYDVNGVEVSGDAKGLVIERKGDGSTVKRLNR
jgi:hypothetical protein